MQNAVHIYVLIDPLTRIPMYVGRTINPLSRRLREHINTAKRGKLKDKRKEQWILGLLEAGERPVISCIEDVSRDAFQDAEKRWVSHYRLINAGLLNVKCGGDGSLGGHFVDWTPERDAMLGVVADAVIAEQMGITRKAVSYRREKLGIAASYDRSRNLPPPPMHGHNKIELPEAILALLGLMSDQDLAARAGVSKKRIYVERKARGIPSYASQTGRTGRFGDRIKARKFAIDDPRAQLLGTEPDKGLAKRWGMSHSRIAAIRRELGIPSYRSKHGTSITTQTN